MEISFQGERRKSVATPSPRQEGGDQSTIACSREFGLVGRGLRRAHSGDRAARTANESSSTAERRSSPLFQKRRSVRLARRLHECAERVQSSRKDFSEFRRV